MLKKLLKYDLKYIYKALLPFYIISCITSLLTLVFYNQVIIKNISICRIIWWILFFITVLLLISSLLNNITRIWTRFINNIYKDESYLTHTLPVTKKQIYLSKFISSFITLITTTLIISLSILIIFYQINSLNSFKEFIDSLSKIFNNKIFASVILLFIIISLEIMNIIQIGFTGILLGYKSNTNKGIKTFTYGLTCYTVQSLLTLLIVFIIGLFSPKVKVFFLENEVPNINELKLFFLGVISLYIISIIIFYIINNKIFNKGVNVD